ncbi:MAG: AAA family ATPase, partial [Polyangiales bacterium]
SRGVIHRDINPRNVFIPGDRLDAPKVLDFGIARPTAATWALTIPGSQLSTPGYMAPEQARGDVDVDARADVFAIGCVLFECLAGRPVFAGDNIMALLSKVLLEEPPRVGTLRPIPPQLDDLVRRMLSKSADGRPRDGAAVVAALAAIALGTEEEPAPSIEAPPASLGEIEQRLVCVVMAGPSADRAVQSEASTLASEGADVATRSRLQRFGARTEWLADGSVVATLVSDGDATDHAAQAARFALALREVVKNGPIVLATGRGVVTGRTPVGEVLDRAARLLQEGSNPTAVSTETPSGEPVDLAARGPTTGTPIRIDDVTAGLLDLRFDVADDPNGRELRGTRDSSDSARTVLGRATSCVGRDRDLSTLEATFLEVASESVARAVLVVGTAGLGKSRLRREFLRRVRRRGEPVEVLFGRADPMSAGAPFAMIAQAVRSAAGISDGEPLPVRRQKIAARVARAVPEADRARVAEFLGELIGAPFPDDHSVQLQAARRDPMLRGDQMRRAWEDWIRAECSRQPLVVLLEDLHWGDLPTVKIIDATLRNLHDQPLMVLALARPEVHELFPSVWQQRGVAELRLAPLTKKAGEKLVREVLGDKIGDDVVQRVVEHAAGNPFCLEELIRAQAEGRSDVLPGTVLATAQARLERLGAGARRVLRAASVFGEAFWRGGVVALLGGVDRTHDVGEWLQYLVDREVIAVRGRRKFPGEDEFAFQHTIMREAAYAMLTPEDRTLGHRLAATWLETAGEGDALTLAQHYDRGKTADGALRWYRRAAEQALEGGDLEATLARAALAIGQGAQGNDLGRLRLLEAEAHKWRGENPLALRAALAAMELLPRGDAAWSSAAGEVAAASGKVGERDVLVNVADQLLELPQSGVDR